MKIPKNQNKDKHQTVNGYLRIGSLYVSLVFLTSALLAAVAFGVLYMTALHPVFVALWYERQSMPAFSIDSPYLAGYNGKAQLYLPDGSLLYEGDVGGAVVSGSGKLYQDGRLLYDGGFAENLYDGQGTLYAQDGSVNYTGGFAENLPHGFGTQSFMLHKESYCYTGMFDAGARSGEGSLSKGGSLIYEGGFKDNARDGFGREYANGRLCYEGSFLHDVYEGEGKLFDGDGRLIYEGGFSDGKYSGNGTEYDPNTGYPVFQGKYFDGVRMEAGTEYDARGEPLVEATVNPDPLGLLDSTYMEALFALKENSAACREQPIDGRRLMIDEAGGAIYAFSLNEAGEPDSVSEIYLCGLASAGGLIVGSDIGNTAELSVKIPEISAGERFALTLSNTFWGKKTPEDELISIELEKDGLIVTAFCEASENPLDSADETDGESADDERSGILGKVLPGDPVPDGLTKELPGDTTRKKAGLIAFLKVARSLESLPEKE